MTPAVDTPKAIELNYNGWHVWRARKRDGQPGAWIATLIDPAVGVDPNVVCDTPEALRTALGYQDRLAAHGRHARQVITA